MVLWSLLAIALSILLVVGVHEAGHALIARLFNVQVTRISIGFGKSLFCWQGKNGTEWVWSLWPLGGYVQLANTRIQPVLKKNLPYCFDKKPIHVRCLILFAGVAFNGLTAWLALVCFFLVGYQQTLPVIDAITPHSIAAKAMLAPGDKIISLAGQKTPSWREVGMDLIKSNGHVVAGIVENSRGHLRPVTLDLTQGLFKVKGMSLLKATGIHPLQSLSVVQKVQGLPLLKATQQALFQLLEMGCFFIVVIKQLVTGLLPFSLLLGPLSLFTLMASSFFQGLAVFLYFIASLSLSVGFINLLPVPGLDGGAILYTFVEKIRGKPLSVAMDVLLHRLMFIAFCLLLLQLLMNDLQRYFN